VPGFPSGAWGHSRTLQGFGEPRAQRRAAGIGLVFELRRVSNSALCCSANSGCDRHILLAVDLEGNRRSRDARSDIDLPQFIERGVVVGCDGTVQQRELTGEGSVPI